MTQLKSCQKVGDLFLRNTVSERILLFVYRKNGEQMNFAKLSRQINATYASTCVNLKLMIEKGVIETKEIDGRSKDIQLTDRGKKIADLINTIRSF